MGAILEGVILGIGWGGLIGGLSVAAWTLLRIIRDL